MQTLSTLEAYLTDWPQLFLRDARRSHVYRCRFEQGRALSLPGWLDSAFRQMATASAGRAA
jgi:hypothetical protein